MLKILLLTICIFSLKLILISAVRSPLYNHFDAYYFLLTFRNHTGLCDGRNITLMVNIQYANGVRETRKLDGVDRMPLVSPRHISLGLFSWNKVGVEQLDPLKSINIELLADENWFNDFSHLLLDEQDFAKTIVRKSNDYIMVAGNFPQKTGKTCKLKKQKCPSKEASESATFINGTTIPVLNYEINHQKSDDFFNRDPFNEMRIYDETDTALMGYVFVYLQMRRTIKSHESELKSSRLSLCVQELVQIDTNDEKDYWSNCNIGNDSMPMPMDDVMLVKKFPIRGKFPNRFMFKLSINESIHVFSISGIMLDKMLLPNHRIRAELHSPDADQIIPGSSPDTLAKVVGRSVKLSYQVLCSGQRFGVRCKALCSQLSRNARQLDCDQTALEIFPIECARLNELIVMKKIKIGDHENPNSDNKNGGSKSIIITISIIAVLVVIAILAVIFMKKKKRNVKKTPKMTYFKFNNDGSNN